MTAPDERSNQPARAAEVDRDLDDTAPALAVGVVSGAQARGAVAYGAIGLCAGLLIGAVIALFPLADLSYWPRLALFGGIGAFAGLVAGAGAPAKRAASASALTPTSFIARLPSPSGGNARPSTVSCNWSGRPMLSIGRSVPAGTSKVWPGCNVPVNSVLFAPS